MSREVSLFYNGTPKEKLRRGICPQGRCVSPLNDGVGTSLPVCCCAHCYGLRNTTRPHCVSCPTDYARQRRLQKKLRDADY